MRVLYMSVYNTIKVEYAFDENILDEIEKKYKNFDSKAKDRLIATCKEQFPGEFDDGKTENFAAGIKALKLSIKEENVSTRPKNSLFVRFSNKSIALQDYDDNKSPSTTTSSVRDGQKQIENQIITINAKKESGEKDELYKERIKEQIKENVFDLVNSTYEQYETKRSNTEPFTKIIFYKQDETTLSIQQTNKSDQTKVAEALKELLSTSTITKQQLNHSKVPLKLPIILSQPNKYVQYEKLKSGNYFWSVFVVYTLYRVHYKGETELLVDETLRILNPEDIKSFQMKYSLDHVPIEDTIDSYFGDNFKNKSLNDILGEVKEFVKHTNKDDLKVNVKAGRKLESKDGPFTISKATSVGSYLSVAFKELPEETFTMKFETLTAPIRVSINKNKDKSIRGLLYRVPKQTTQESDKIDDLKSSNLYPPLKKQQTKFYYMKDFQVTEKAIRKYMNFQKLQDTREEYIKQIIHIFTSQQKLEGLFTYCESHFKHLTKKNGKGQQSVIDLLLSRGHDFFTKTEETSKVSKYQIDRVFKVGIVDSSEPSKTGTTEEYKSNFKKRKEKIREELKANANEHLIDITNKEITDFCDKLEIKNSKSLEQLIRFYKKKMKEIDNKDIPYYKKLCSSINKIAVITDIDEFLDPLPCPIKDANENEVLMVNIKLKHKRTVVKEKEEDGPMDCKKRSKTIKKGLDSYINKISRTAKVYFAKYMLGGTRKNSKRIRRRRIRKRRTRKNRT